MPRYGAYSKEIRLARPDGRSRQGRLLTQMRRQLTAQLGGNPTPTQVVLIQTAAMLQLKCATFDQKIIDGTFSDYDSKVYLAYANSLRRTLDSLGLAAAPAPKPTLQERLRQEADERVTVLHRAAR